MKPQPSPAFRLTADAFAYVLADPGPAAVSGPNTGGEHLLLADVLQPPTVFGSDSASRPRSLDTGWDALLALDFGRAAVTLPVPPWSAQ